MKLNPKVATLAATLTLAGLSFAGTNQQLVDRLNRTIHEFQQETSEIKALGDATGAKLEDRKKNLDATADLLKGAMTNFESKADDLKMRIDANNTAAENLKAQEATLKQQIDNHNSHCDGTYSDRGYVASCNAEATNLNAQRDSLNSQADRITANANSLNQEHVDLIQYGQGLKERFDQLEADTLEWTTEKKQYITHRNQLISQTHDTLVQLKQLSAQLSNCVDREPADADDAQIKHDCGDVQFDGVRAMLQRLKDVDPSTIMPGEPGQ